MTPKESFFREHAALLLAAVLFAFVWGMRMWLVIFASPGKLVSLPPDDAWYYFAIAQHIASGAGSTFDGLNLTNGYHPLWQLVCSSMALIMGAAPGEPESALAFARHMLSIQLLIGMFAVGSLAGMVWRISGSSLAAAIVLSGSTLPHVVYAMTDGMESGLVLLFLSALFYFSRRFQPLSKRPGVHDIAFGAVLSLGIMARLDLVFLLPALGVAAAWLRWREDDIADRINAGGLLQKGALWLLAPSVMLAFYLLLNGLHFDTRLPISGTLKSTFPVPGIRGEVLRAHALPFAVGLAGAFICMYVALGRRFPMEVRIYCGMGGVYILLHAAYLLLFVSWGVHSWYFVSYWIFTLVAVSAVVSRMAVISGRPLPPLLGPVLIVLLGFAAVMGQRHFLGGREDRAFQVRSYRAALWAREEIPSTAQIGMTDCGAFGYFRGGGVVNLDGVVNNREYQEALAAGRFIEYLDEKGVRYIAHHAVQASRVEADYGEYVYRVRGRLQPGVTGIISLAEDAEVYRSAVYNDGTGEKVFVIWQLTVRDFMRPGLLR